MNNDTSDTPTIQIPLTQGFICIIDEIDSDLAKLKWFVYIDRKKGRTQYAMRKSRDDKGRRFNIKIYNIILERKLGRPLEKGEVCDHINHDGLDNRRCNLRAATLLQNALNHPTQLNNTSGYRGVARTSGSSTWTAYIKANQKRMHLGCFRNIKDAARAYNEAALKYHGEFAQLNVIED